MTESGQSLEAKEDLFSYDNSITCFEHCTSIPMKENFKGKLSEIFLLPIIDLSIMNGFQISKLADVLASSEMHLVRFMYFDWSDLAIFRKLPYDQLYWISPYKGKHVTSKKRRDGVKV